MSVILKVSKALIFVAAQTLKTILTGQSTLGAGILGRRCPSVLRLILPRAILELGAVLPTGQWDGSNISMLTNVMLSKAKALIETVRNQELTERSLHSFS